MKNIVEFEKDCQLITDKIRGRKSCPEDIVIGDGVIDIQKYLAQKTKILWILKEANTDPDEDWSFVDKYNNEEWVRKYGYISTIKRVMYVSYGILYTDDAQWSEFPWYYEKECYKSLQDIAYINLKKTPGGSVSDSNVIKEAYRENRELIMQQVKTYDPDVIIFGGTFCFFENGDFSDLNDEDRMISDFGNHYYNGNKRLYISAWHPGCRGAGFTDVGYVMDIVQIFRDWQMGKENT